MSVFHSPSSLDEALHFLKAEPQARCLAGGSDLLVRLRHVAPAAWPALIDLQHLGELQGIHAEGESLIIGASTSFAQIAASPLLAVQAPVLQAAALTIGAPALRHMATLGGNLCTASPAGDSLPPLHVLDAEVELLSHAGCRRLPVAQFIRGPGKTALEPGEILGRVRLPRPSASFSLVQRFEKTGRRQSLAIAVASFAGLLRLDLDGRIEAARFAWGSVGPTVQAVPEAELLLRGQPAGSIPPALLQQAVDAVRSSVRPIDDLRASARYRRALAGNLLRRFLVQAAAGKKPHG